MLTRSWNLNSLGPKLIFYKRGEARYRKSSLPLVMVPRRTNQNENENWTPMNVFFYDPENKIFFGATPEISQVGRIVYFICC